jgi:predicted  nucleic acid-binding Zn-ribbon protein
MDGTKAGTCECGFKGELDRRGRCPECACQAYEAHQFDEAEHPDPEGEAVSSTPETDAAWSNPKLQDRAFYSNCQSVSQRLERERDAARKEIRVSNEARRQAEADMFKAMDSNEAIATLRRTLHAQDDNVQRLERERDAARAALRALVRQIEGYASTDEADKHTLALARAALKGGA